MGTRPALRVSRSWNQRQVLGYTGKQGHTVLPQKQERLEVGDIFCFACQSGRCPWPVSAQGSVSVSSAPPERGTNPKPSSSECCCLCSQTPIRIPVTLTFPLGFRAAPQAAHAGGGWSLPLRVGGGTASGARPCPTTPRLPLGSSGPSRHWPGRQLVPSYGRQQYLHLCVHLAVRSKLIY